MVDIIDFEGWDIGNKCPKCGKGKLYPTDEKKEEKPNGNKRKTLIKLKCTECDYTKDELILREPLGC